MKTFTNCPMCGYRYEVGSGPACQSCPLNRGCGLVCCPACGYQSVAPEHSWLASKARSWFSPGRSRRWRRRRHHRFCLTLLDVPVGYRARVTGFLEGFPAERRASLQAYGLSRDDWVTVLQNSPVTVVQLDNTELALENELAERIQVSQILKEEQDENRQ